MKAKIRKGARVRQDFRWIVWDDDKVVLIATDGAPGGRVLLRGPGYGGEPHGNGAVMAREEDLQVIETTKIHKVSVDAEPIMVEDAERLRQLFEMGAGQPPGVLPLYIDDGEIIFCSAISGGANYVDGMPAELVLTRQLPDGTRIHRRYVQKDI